MRVSLNCILLDCIGNFMLSISIILGRHSREAIRIHWTKAQFYQIQYTLLNKNIPLLHIHIILGSRSSLVGGIIIFLFYILKLHSRYSGNEVFIVDVIDKLMLSYKGFLLFSKIQTCFKVNYSLWISLALSCWEISWS